MVVTEDIVVNIRMDEGKVITGLLKTRENLTRLGKAGFATGNAIKTVDNRLKRFNVDTKKASQVMGQFKFEMLGVLFFGMAISRFFKSLLKPSFDVAETFTILNDILSILFLDTALKVNDVLFVMAEALEDLPKEVRDFAGAFALVGIGLGDLIADFGIFVLGITSLKTAFPGLNKSFGVFAKRWGPLGIGIGLAALALKGWSDKTTESKINTGLLNIAVGGLLALFGPGKLKLVGRIIIATGVLEILLGVLDELEEKFNILSKIEKTAIAILGPRGGQPEPNFSSVAAGGPVNVPPPSERNFTANIDVTVNTTDGVNGEDLALLIANQFNELFGEATSTSVGSISRR